MIEPIAFILSFLAGALTAVLFLFLLWRSVQNISARNHPGRFLLGTLLLRLTLVAGIFYGIVSLGGWQHLLSALLGFITVKFMAINPLTLKKLIPAKPLDPDAGEHGK